MVVLTIAALSLIASCVLIGVDAYGIYQSSKDAGEQIGAIDALTESLEGLFTDLVGVLTDIVTAIQDAAIAIMQYMDIWGIVIISCVAVVGVISFLNLIVSSRRVRH